VTGRLQPAVGVAVVEAEGVVYAASLPDGPIVVLEGGAAAIWIEACRGDRASVAQRVAKTTGTSIETVAEHVESFVDQLLQRGLLVKVAE